jgi:16S rRNA processing protein RimM
MSRIDTELVTMGRIGGVYGLRGWLRIFSYTEPLTHILDYNPWRINLGRQWRAMQVDDGRRHGKGLVAHLVGCEDRDTAQRLVGAEIVVHREQLPALEEGDYYWGDLIGLDVETANGIQLGVVDYLLETGANDVLVVKGDRERLIPFLLGQVVLEVDLKGRYLRVDWDPEF